MTWKEFVECIESQGVTDETEIDSISYHGNDDPIVSLMHDGNTVVIDDGIEADLVDFGDEPN